jgi:hypothetical protein
MDCVRHVIARSGRSGVAHILTEGHVVTSGLVSHQVASNVVQVIHYRALPICHLLSGMHLLRTC